MTNKTPLTLTDETKARLIADIESGSAIVINVVSVAGGGAEFQIGSFLTGTKEERSSDLQHQALGFMTNSLARMLGEVIQRAGLTGAAVTQAIKANTKLARILKPGLPEEDLTILDNAESYDDAMKQLGDSAISVVCECEGCTKGREQKAEETVNDAPKEAGASIH